MTEAILPLPPSANNLFLNYGRGRARTKQYNDWLLEAGLILNRARLKAAGPVMVCIRAGKMNALRDLDNLIKPSVDLLVKCSVLENDTVKYVKAVVCSDASDAIPAGFIGVSICEPAGQFFAPHMADMPA